MILLQGGALWASAASDLEYDARVELEAVQTMVDEGRLDDAIQSLVEIARKDPEQMERVQQLILDIQEYKNRLNELFAEANQALDSENAEAALDSLTTIREEFPHLNRSDRNKLIIITTAVGRQADFDIRDRFFDRAEPLLAAGDYRGAVDIYRQGMESPEYNDLLFYEDYSSLAASGEPIPPYDVTDPYREDLLRDAYTTIAPAGENLVSELYGSLDNWDGAAADLPEIAAAASAGISQVPAVGWDEETADLIRSLGEIDADLQATAALTEDLNDVRLRLNAALEGAPEEFHFERVGQFLNGRPENAGEEGIFYAQERLRESVYQDLARQMSGILENLVDAGHAAYRAGDWGEVQTTEEELVSTARAYLSYLENGRSLNPERLSDFLDQESVFVAYSIESAPFRSELAGLNSEVPDVENLDFETLDIGEIDALADPIQTSVIRTEALLSNWSGIDAGLENRSGAGENRSERIDSRLRDDLAAAIESFRDLRLRLYVNAIIPLYENLEQRTQEAMAVDIGEVRNSVNGVGDDQETLPERHPSDTLLTTIEPSLEGMDETEAFIGGFLDVLDEMLTRNPPIENPEEVVRYRSRAENLLRDVGDKRTDLEDLRDEALVLVAAARRSETSAVNALDEARRDLVAANTALQQGAAANDIEEYYRAVNLYNAVDGSLDRVDNFYLDILVNDVDIAEASGINQERQNLRNQVQAARGQVAVTVKQNAVNEGRTAYDEGRYAQGAAIVDQSQEFWNRAYGEDDPELAAWLQRLVNAQQALQQTVINPNDPLYTEMNQYLNLANRYYENGVRLASASPGSSDVMLAFDSASDLLGQVLSTFPGNEAALLLEQKILRQESFDQWSREARNLMTGARRAVSTGNLNALRGSDTEKGFYAQLKVLEQIDPGYSGLEDLIYDAEVVLGIVIPPTPQAVINESLRLTANAQQIWDNLGLAGSDQARNLLRQALETWPENTRASALNNEILLSSEPEELPRLPPDLEYRLTLFDQYYAERNFITAKAIIDAAISLYPGYTDDPRVRERRNQAEVSQ